MNRAAWEKGFFLWVGKSLLARVREESIGKRGDGPSAKTGFWNLRAKAMGFASHLSLDSETAQLKNTT